MPRSTPTTRCGASPTASPRRAASPPPWASGRSRAIEMSTIVNTLQEIVRHELRGLRVAELGVVEAVLPHAAAGDHDNYACDVRLKNSGLLLKRVPVLAD